MAMDEEIKRWTAQRKAAVVLEIIQGKTTVAEVTFTCEASGFFNSLLEGWTDMPTRT
jgi:transposase-like protein